MQSNQLCPALKDRCLNRKEILNAIIQGSISAADLNMAEKLPIKNASYNFTSMLFYTFINIHMYVYFHMYTYTYTYTFRPYTFIQMAH